jgi:type IV pilus assembly protein PilV
VVEFNMSGHINIISRGQDGVTLLEVLIALLVLSIGLLGLAALQTTALRASQTATMHTRAVQLVHDVSERLRAGTGDHYTANVNSGFLQTELRSWRSLLTALPDGQADIQPCTASTQPACPAIDGHIVTVYWNAARDPAVNGFNCPPQSALDYRCYRLVTP